MHWEKRKVYWEERKAFRSESVKYFSTKEVVYITSYFFLGFCSWHKVSLSSSYSLMMFGPVPTKVH